MINIHSLSNGKPCDWIERLVIGLNKELSAYDLYGSRFARSFFNIHPLSDRKTCDTLEQSRRRRSMSERNDNRHIPLNKWRDWIQNLSSDWETWKTCHRIKCVWLLWIALRAKISLIYTSCRIESLVIGSKALSSDCQTCHRVERLVSGSNVYDSYWSRFVLMYTPCRIERRVIGWKLVIGLKDLSSERNTCHRIECVCLLWIALRANIFLIYTPCRIEGFAIGWKDLSPDSKTCYRIEGLVIGSNVYDYYGSCFTQNIF